MAQRAYRSAEEIGLTGQRVSPIMESMNTSPIIPLAKLERIMIVRALQQYPNVREAAQVLGIGKTTLYRKLAECKAKENKP